MLISTSSRLPLVANPALRRLVPVARRIGPVVDWGRGFNSFSVVRRWGLGPNAQEKHVDMTNEMILRAPTRVLTDFHPMFAALDVRHALETLSLVRTVVVGCTHDSVTPLSHSRRIADGIAGLVAGDLRGHRPHGDVRGARAGHRADPRARGEDRSVSTALDVIDAGPEHAQAVVDIIHRSFGARPTLDPPSTALEETVESVAEVLAGPGGLLVERRGEPMGALLFDESRPGLLGLRRVSVDPDLQARGVASAMVGVAEDTAEERGKDGIWLRVREELPDTVQFWSRRRYHPLRRDGAFIEFGKTLWLAREVPTPEAMHDLAAKTAELVRPGDLLVLTGDLGAGKTTFTQGLGEALKVRGPVTSPTFVLARTHPSLVDGPALVHVDAYRLGTPRRSTTSTSTRPPTGRSPSSSGVPAWRSS